MSRVPFGDRLQALLREREPDRSQTWLSDQSGVDRSLISRIVGGKRSPTAETLQALAPALGLDVSALVHGTDAEARLMSVSDYVRRADYEEAVEKAIEYEARARDLEARCRSQKEQLAAEAKARRDAEHALALANDEAISAQIALSRLREEYEARFRRTGAVPRSSTACINRALHAYADDAQQRPYARDRAQSLQIRHSPDAGELEARDSSPVDP